MKPHAEFASAHVHPPPPTFLAFVMIFLTLWSSASHSYVKSPEFLRPQLPA